jgi:hypothetical protein
MSSPCRQRLVQGFSPDDVAPRPQYRSGWPWTDGGPTLSPVLPDGTAWPRISIVTPSFNQGRFIEETIRSVLLQGYPNLEYIVIDGGSKDNTLEVIKRYSPWLTYWVSEPDGGQSHAINKGLARCTGEVFNWINSDDLLAPSSLHEVARRYSDGGGGIVAGVVRNFGVDAQSERVFQRGITLENATFFWQWDKWLYHQPGLFLPLVPVRQLGGVDERLRYAMDHDLILRLLAEGVPVAYTDRVLAHFRLQADSKTCTSEPHFLAEFCQVSYTHRHCVDNGVIGRWRREIADWMVTAIVREVRSGDRRAALRLLAHLVSLAPWLVALGPLCRVLRRMGVRSRLPSSLWRADRRRLNRVAGDALRRGE